MQFSNTINENNHGNIHKSRKKVRENPIFLKIQENTGIKKNTGKYRNEKKIQKIQENTGTL